MKTLVINAGSSSIKYKLFQMSDETVLAEGLVERIGEEIGRIKHSACKKEFLFDEKVDDHQAGLNRIASLLVSTKEGGVIKNSSEVTKVIHRVVHGGAKFVTPVLIDRDIILAIKENIPLAPLHNPPNLIGIEVASKVFESAKQIAVFDTAFHQTMPASAYTYAIPTSLASKHKIRKYGFHGSSHSYVAKRAASMLKKDLTSCSMITLHLGNGCSMAAIKDGESIDTTMGMTPLEGLVMGSRCGDIDPAVPLFLSSEENLDLAAVDNLLNKKSGLIGLCGSNDLRDILKMCAEGESSAITALDIYVRRIKKYIGSYLAILPKIDTIVFTAGVGENSSVIREMVCSSMKHLGIEVDSEKNRKKEFNEREIQTVNSLVKVFIIPTDEELEMARVSENI